MGCWDLNQLSTKALFPSGKPLGLVLLLGHLEANPADYDHGRLLTDETQLKPLNVPIYKGMKIVLFTNVRKDADFVNGMDCEVVAFHVPCKAVEVMTTTKKRVMINPWCDVEHEKKIYDPLKPGYADTILKFQGSELQHPTFYLDVVGIPRAVCTALSRVSRGDLLLIEHAPNIYNKKGIGKSAQSFLA